MKDKVLSVVYGVAVFFCILTFCISLPIYARFFYYMQIEPLGLPKETGYDAATIRQAYDEVLDYLTLPGKSFGTGVFAHSEEGAAHFADCKALFTLNGTVLLLSSAVVAILLFSKRKRWFASARPFGLRLNVIPATVLLLLMTAIGVFVAVDFDTAFTVFHAVCFPNKDNWLFSGQKDPIIYILPETFFLRCGVWIITSMVFICLIIIVTAVIEKVHIKKPAKN